MAKKKHKPQNQLQQTKPQKGSINSLAFIKEALTLIGGLAGSILAVYGLVKTFKDDVEGFSWLIPVGIVIWLLILWRLFQVRKTTAYSLFIISILLGASGWIGWQSQVKATEKKLVVLVALFDGPEETYGLRSQIMEGLHNVAKEYHNVVITDGKETISAGQGTEYARELGKREDSDVVIWGWYRPTENPNITIHIENLSPENSLPIEASKTLQPATSLADLKSFSFQQQAGQDASVLIYFLSGYLDYKNENYQSALERFNNAIENFSAKPILLENKVQSELYFYRASTNSFLKEYQRAIQDFDQAIQIDPQGSIAYYNRGIAYADLGEYQRAIQDFDQAIQIDPQYAMAYNNRGSAYGILGEYQHAIQDYDQAIQIDPQAAIAYDNRGNAYDYLGESQRAIQDYDQAIHIDPQYAMAYYNRGLAYYNLGEYQRAIQDYDQAIQIDPQYAAAYNNRGNAYSNVGEYQRAIQDFDQAIQIDSQHAAAYNNRGLAYYYLAEYQRAIQDFDQSIQLDPQYAEAYNNRGLAYNDLGEYQRAIQDFDQAIRLDPQYAAAYINRGNTYYRLGEYQRAMHDFDQTIQIDPQLAGAYKNRGLAYQQLGQTAEAEADFKKYEELTGQKP